MQGPPMGTLANACQVKAHHRAYPVSFRVLPRMTLRFPTWAVKAHNCLDQEDPCSSQPSSGCLFRLGQKCSHRPSEASSSGAYRCRCGCSELGREQRSYQRCFCLAHDPFLCQFPRWIPVRCRMLFPLLLLNLQVCSRQGPVRQPSWA